MAAVAACLVTVAGLTPALGAEDTRYMSVTLRGRINDPSTGTAMAGAVVRVTATEESGNWVESTTNERGEFVLEGLAFGNYSVEITTAEGEKIRGINSFPVGKDKVRVTLVISEKGTSSMTLDNQPARLAAVVEDLSPDWKRFWKEFGIFFGVAIGAGAAAL